MSRFKENAMQLFSLLLCLCLLLSLFCSCRGGSAQKSIAWLLNSSPRNLDPQTASSESELIIIKNCFTGLFEKSEGGELVSSIVEHYDVSENGLDYTFYLYDDIYWSIYEERQIKKYAPITADDFVFAIERVFKDNPDADVMNILKNIKNADKVLAGESISKLKIKASDDKTLKITLAQKNSALPEAFISHTLFPCNREFFNSTSGRYGLGCDTMIFNGCFYLKNWGESSLKLEKNKFAEYEPKIDAVTLYMPKSTREHTALLKEGDIDAALLSSEQFSKLDPAAFNSQNFTSTLWALVFNEQNEIWQNKNLRDAVLLSTDRTKIQLGNHLAQTNQLISPSAQVFSKNYRELAKNVTAPDFAPESAKTHYQTALAELERTEILNAEILITDSEQSKNAFAPLNQIYQRELPLYFSPQYLSRDEIKARVKSGNFAAAVIPLDISANTPSAFFEYFLNNSPQCIFGINNADFENFYNSALYAQNAETAAEAFSNAEKTLLDTSLISPLYFESSYFVSLKTSSGYELDSSGAVLFKNVVLK